MLSGKLKYLNIFYLSINNVKLFIITYFKIVNDIFFQRIQKFNVLKFF